VLVTAEGGEKNHKALTAEGAGEENQNSIDRRGRGGRRGTGEPQQTMLSLSFAFVAEEMN
jgi:hypothetical protein